MPLIFDEIYVGSGSLPPGLSCLSVRQRTEGDQLDQHPARTEVDEVEDMDLDKEDGDAEVPAAVISETMGNPMREVPLLLTPCGKNCHQLFSQ